MSEHTHAFFHWPHGEHAGEHGSRPSYDKERPPREWRPIQHVGADGLLLTFIAVFGVTVVVTRIYLELTGFPQVGNATFHIAHVLWGGLAMFIALMLLLVFVNRWALWLACVLGGIGIGLFIDEVGKFLTRTNDYFFPLAFPIIYSLMMVCVWLFVRVRHSRLRNSRVLLYHALEDVLQVLDNDLDPIERKRLVQTLTVVQQSAQDPSHRRLAADLLDYVNAQDPAHAPSLNWFVRKWETIRACIAQHPTQRVLRIALVLGFLLMSSQGLVKLVNVAIIYNRGSLVGLLAEFSNYEIVSGNSRYVVNHPEWLLFHAALIALTGLLALAAAALIAVGRDRLGLRIGVLALTLALTVVNLIMFYFAQIYTFIDMSGQLLLLALAQWYRWRFFPSPAVGADAPVLLP